MGTTPKPLLDSLVEYLKKTLTTDPKTMAGLTYMYGPNVRRQEIEEAVSVLANDYNLRIDFTHNTVAWGTPVNRGIAGVDQYKNVYESSVQTPQDPRIRVLEQQVASRDTEILDYKLEIKALVRRNNEMQRVINKQNELRTPGAVDQIVNLAVDTDTYFSVFAGFKATMPVPLKVVRLCYNDTWIDTPVISSSISGPPGAKELLVTVQKSDDQES